jgi:hypothetical protein
VPPRYPQAALQLIAVFVQQIAMMCWQNIAERQHDSELSAKNLLSVLTKLLSNVNVS